MCQNPDGYTVTLLHSTCQKCSSLSPRVDEASLLMFIAGFTQLKDVPSEVFTSLFDFDDYGYRHYFKFSSSLCHMLFEAQSFEIVVLTFSNSKHCPCLLTSFDAFALAYTTSHSLSTAL